MMNQLLDLGVEKERIGFIEEFQKNYDICIQVVKQNTINIISNDIVIQCENEIEFMIAQEIFAKEEYGFHMEENYFVIDIGMNIGCTSLYFASKDNVTYVYGFEPCETVYNKAMNNIYKNDKKIQNKIKTYNIGLSGKNGVEKYIAHHGIFESAGIKKVQEGTEHSDNIINIEVNQASNILKSIFSYHSEKCLMKLDCEGAEYEILEDLIKSNIISKVDVIIMEWHVGKYKQLENLMKICGFKFLLNKNDRDFGMCYAWR